MEIVFLAKDYKKVIAFKIKTITDKEWSGLKLKATEKLGKGLAIIFWDNKKIFPFNEVDVNLVSKELGIPKTQF